MPPLKKADQQAKLSGRQPKAFGQKTRRVALMLHTYQEFKFVICTYHEYISLIAVLCVSMMHVCVIYLCYLLKMADVSVLDGNNIDK